MSARAALQDFAERVATGEYHANLHPKAAAKIRKNVQRNWYPILTRSDMEEPKFRMVEYRDNVKGPEFSTNDKQELLMVFAERMNKLITKGWVLTRESDSNGLPTISGVFGNHILVIVIISTQLALEPVTTPEPATSEPTAEPVEIPDGIYTVVRGEQYRTFRVKTANNGNLQGKRIVEYLSGADNDNDFTGFAFLNGKQISLWTRYRNSAGSILLSFASYLGSDWKSAGEAYAIRSGKCYRCGHTLTVPTSLHRGLGPECAKKI